MSLKKSSKKKSIGLKSRPVGYVSVFASVLLLALLVYASGNFYQVSGVEDICEYSNFQRVDATGEERDVFVPAGSQEEWDAFVANVASNTNVDLSDIDCCVDGHCGECGDWGDPYCANDNTEVRESRICYECDDGVCVDDPEYDTLDTCTAEEPCWEFGEEHNRGCQRRQRWEECDGGECVWVYGSWENINEGRVCRIITGPICGERWECWSGSCGLRDSICATHWGCSSVCDCQGTNGLPIGASCC